MLACQRHQFDIPDDVCYLSAASYSPLPRAVQEAGRSGVARKARPWLLDGQFITAQNDRARRAAARLIGAEPADIALVPSIAYGFATAGKLIAPSPGSRVIVIEDDHSSPVLEWLTRSREQGFTVETVSRPADGDWTGAVLEAIARPGAAPVSLASLSSVHWSDGALIDLDKVATALRRQGAALAIDATQSAGVLALDVAKLDPDFVMFPTYKWLLGPYGRAFLYVARRHQGGIPLEQTAHGRRAVKAEQAHYFADTRYAADASRFDMAERDHFISMEMASVGIETMLGWGHAAIAERTGALARRLAAGLEGAGVRVLDARFRSPHILSLAFAAGMPAGLVERLAAERVYVAPRLGRLRLSPHVYNDERDVDRFLAVFRRLIA